MNQWRKNNQEREFIVSCPSLPKSGKGRKSCHNPEKRESAEALGVESNVDEVEFEVTVVVRKMTSILGCKEWINASSWEGPMRH